MEVEIQGQKYKLKALSYLEGLEIAEVREKDSMTQAAKKMFIFSGIPDEVVTKISAVEGAKIQQEINKLNEVDFQKPTDTDKN